MYKKGLTLALTALAITVMTGCKEPVGLPNNRVHAATLDTLVIPVNYTQNYTGDVDHVMEGNPIKGWYETHYQDTIKWGYFYDPEGRPYHAEDWRGFATFRVPPFLSPNYIPVCTLHYYVAECYEFNDDSIQVNCFTPAFWTWVPESLFNAIDTSTATLAKDTSPTSTGWHKVALTTQGCGIIATVGAEAEQQGDTLNLFTGWKYLNYYYDYWQTKVVGPDDAVSPYITVIYQPGP